MPSTLIFGYGYLGERVGRLLLDRGETVFGTTRDPAKADRLRGLGVMPVLLDVTQPASLTNLPNVDRVLYCVGFDRRAGQGIRAVYVDGFRAALGQIRATSPRCPVVYASSTGVYGGDDADWVDETTPVTPHTESGRACFDAEQVLAEAGGPSIILRFAGLYGPDRIMRREGLIRGEPVVGNPDKFLNFIQIDDAATVAVRALDEVAKSDTDLFLVSDGHPVSRTQFYATTAELLGASSPRFEDPKPGTPEAKREESNKRINNRKLLDRWGSILQYPDIRSGLFASLKAETSPRS